MPVPSGTSSLRLGRERDIAELDEGLGLAGDGTPQIVLVGGDARDREDHPGGCPGALAIQWPRERDTRVQVDGCNGEIPVFQPDGRGGPDPTKLPPLGRLMPVSVLDGAALCPDCFQGRVLDIRVAGKWPGSSREQCRSACR